MNLSLNFGHLIDSRSVDIIKSNLAIGGIIIVDDMQDLEQFIRDRSFAYTKVYTLNSFYKYSYIIYSKDKNGNIISFDRLLEFAKEIYRESSEKNVCIQEAGKQPYRIDADGNNIGTVELDFDSIRVRKLSIVERMRQEQYGEILLE